MSKESVDAGTTSGTGEDVSAQERLGWLARNPKTWLLTVLLLLVAVLVVTFSFSLFTSSSANPGNTITAGNLSQSNSQDGAAVLTASKMVPGDSTNGEVTITNTGDVSGTFTLTSSDLADTPGPNGGELSSVLELTVVDNTTGTPTEVYTGPIDQMPATPLGTWDAGEHHKYTFTATFPDGGVPSSATGGDNAYKSSSMTIQFNWSATS
jgi:hypothetical protein